jgi:hypothetical protein
MDPSHGRVTTALSVQTLTEFIKEDEIKLKRDVTYWLTDIAVTSDNKLLLCNSASSIITLLFPPM